MYSICKCNHIINIPVSLEADGFKAQVGPNGATDREQNLPINLLISISKVLNLTVLY